MRVHYMGYILFTLFRSFWTSSMTSTASTSNPPLFLVPFGLPRAFPPLQSPIHHFPSHLLDFLRVSLRFKVQSTAFSRSFWTSSCLLSASKSNPPHFLASFLHIYTNLTLKKFNFTPLLSCNLLIFSPPQKTPAGTSPAGAFEKHTNY